MDSYSILQDLLEVRPLPGAITLISYHSDSSVVSTILYYKLLSQGLCCSRIQSSPLLSSVPSCTGIPQISWFVLDCTGQDHRTARGIWCCTSTLLTVLMSTPGYPVRQLRLAGALKEGHLFDLILSGQKDMSVPGRNNLEVGDISFAACFLSTQAWFWIDFPSNKR